MDNQQHRVIISRHIKDKIAEYDYYLLRVVDSCDVVREQFNAKQDPTIDAAINYHFNSLLNTFQSIKDSFETIFGIDIPWSSYTDIPHFQFFKESRNAITHDGLQIINCYADGKFLIAGPIKRFDKKANLLEIKPPETDLRTFCLQFTIGLMSKLESLLNEHSDRVPIGNNMFRMSQYEFALNSPHIPYFAKELIRQNREKTLEILSTLDSTVVADLKAKIQQLRTTSESKLNCL